MTEEQVETQEKVLEKASKNLFQYFKSILKNTTKLDWEDAAKEVVIDTKKCSETTF